MNIYFSFLCINGDIDIKSRYFQLINLYFIFRLSTMINSTVNTDKKKRRNTTANGVVCGCIQSFMVVAILVPGEIKQIMNGYDTARLGSLTRSIHYETTDCIASVKLEKTAKYVLFSIRIQNGRIYTIKDRETPFSSDLRCVFGP